MINRHITFLFLIWIFSSSGASAQVFKGKILDNQTGEAIPYCTIFLTNTTSGVSADADGNFSLKMPHGNYEVVVRMLGYTLMVFPIQTDKLKPFYEIHLQPDISQLLEVKIEGKRDEVWHRNLKIFEDYFLGTSNIAKKSKILNPEVLILDSESYKNILTAKANDVIKIINPKLGYEIDYILTFFKLDSSSNEVFYKGYPSFRNMSKYESRVPKRIIKSREEAYLGSLNHFLRCVFYETDKEEGYLVRRVKLATNPDRPSDTEIGLAKKRISQTADYANKDSLFRNFVTKERLSLYAGVRYFPYTKVNTFTERLKNDKVMLKFDDFLEVTYTKEYEDKSYKGTSAQYTLRPQKSFIKLTGPIAVINYQGVTLNPFDLYLLGYMGWEKMGDMMPIDYVP